MYIFQLIIIMPPSAVHTNTHLPEHVVLVPRLAFAAVGAWQILARLSISTAVYSCLTLIHIWTRRGTVGRFMGKEHQHDIFFFSNY